MRFNGHGQVEYEVTDIEYIALAKYSGKDYNLLLNRVVDQTKRAHT